MSVGVDGLRAGERIARFREGLGESQLEFASNLNVRLPVLQAVEAGREPPTRLVHQVARYVGVSPDYVLHGEGAVGVETRPGFVLLRKLLALIPPHRIDPILTVVCRALMAANAVLARDEQAPKEPPSP